MARCVCTEGRSRGGRTRSSGTASVVLVEEKPYACTTAVGGSLLPINVADRWFAVGVRVGLAQACSAGGSPGEARMDWSPFFGGYAEASRRRPESTGQKGLWPGRRAHTAGQRLERPRSVERGHGGRAQARWHADSGVFEACTRMRRSSPSRCRRSVAPCGRRYRRKAPNLSAACCAKGGSSWLARRAVRMRGAEPSEGLGRREVRRAVDRTCRERVC